ncbi:MAG: pilus assembly protein [Gammaproteobacteria bacterium]
MKTPAKRYWERARAAALALLLLPTVTAADDTDIYLNPSVPVGAEPLVMFVLDWRPNLGSSVACAAGSYCDELRADGYLSDGEAAGSGNATTFFDVLRAVLKKVLDPLGGVQIGFMLNHANKNNCAGFPPSNKCSNGAYIPFGFTSMTAGSDDPDSWQASGEDSDKVDLAALLDAIPFPQGNQSHPFQGKEVYFELFRYLTGQGIYNGHTGYVDYGDGPNDTRNLDVDRPALAWDTSIETGGGANTRYVSPLATATQCTRIFVINLMFQVSAQEDDSDAAILDDKADGGMAGINLSGNNNSFDTVIEYMNDVDLGDGTFGTVPTIDGDQNVVSYFVVDPTKINTTTNGYAAAGGTGVPLSLSDDPQALVETLSNIFDSILSVSTTFVAPSVPVNVFNRAQIINEVFLALFEADENGLPFWPGNLKKVVIGENAVTGLPELQDANGLNAIDIDGRLKRNAVTLWTDPATLPAPTGDEVAGADGRSIQRGGAGQKIPGFVGGAPGLLNSELNARQLYTEDPADAVDGLMPLNGDATTAETLWGELTASWDTPPSAGTYAAAPAAEQNRAINDLRCTRGLAAVDINDTSTMRPWYLGDPLHSRPRPINYGVHGGYSASNPDIRVLMATTDGILHLFTNTTAAGSQSGAETWGFVPREVLDAQDRLRLAQTGTPVHPISFDGSPVVYALDNDFDGNIESADGDKVWAFVGMRRGGKSYYALDLTNPDAPKFMWSINKADADFGELAQTWSTPRVARLDVGSGVRPMLIFGGGYNGDDDGDNVGDLGKDAANRNGASGSNDDEGNAIFIIDAETGALVWKAVLGGSEGYTAGTETYTHPSLLDSIPAEIAAGDTDGNGVTDRIYFGDTGGRVWRGDIAGTDRNNWTLRVLLDAGRHFDATATNDLRFFNRPDIVQTRDGNGNYDAVVIGSGDRENPLDEDVENWLFMIKDRNTTSGMPPSTTLLPTNLADLTVDCVGAGNCDASTQNNLTLNGWRMGLAGTGEKNLANAITIGGSVFFTSFMPGSSGTCGLSEGTGLQYAVSLQDATAIYNYDLSNDGSGLTLDRSDKLASGGIPVEVVPVGDDYVLVQGQEAGQNIQKVNASTSWRTYWYER